MAGPPGLRSFTTGQVSLPDTGVLSYNGCIFSPLFHTKVSGRAIEDDANRTVMYVEYTITVDGYVTLPAGSGTISPTMQTLRSLLMAQGGALTYVGRGNDIVVNTPGGTSKDAAWGPIPQILEFEPLGGTRSAKIVWTVKVRIVEPGSAALTGGPSPPGPPNGGSSGGAGGGFNSGVVHPGPSKVFN